MAKTTRKTRTTFNAGTQNAMLLNTLRRRPVTEGIARSQLRIRNLRARVYDLRSNGYSINTLVSDSGPTKYVLA